VLGGCASNVLSGFASRVLGGCASRVLGGFASRVLGGFASNVVPRKNYTVQCRGRVHADAVELEQIERSTHLRR